MPRDSNNRQVRRTREALLQAFRELILEGRYASARVADIVRRANVGRSTFYEHFRNKDDILRETLRNVLAVLAEAVRDDCDLKRLESILEHFRVNRRVGRGLFSGPTARHVVRVLSGLIDAELTTLRRKTKTEPAIPRALVAAQIAEGQLGLIRAWDRDGMTCSTAALAAAMHQSAKASAAMAGER